MFQPPSDDDLKIEICAYLDGRLDDEQAATLEARLLEDQHARSLLLNELTARSLGEALPRHTRMPCRKARKLFRPYRRGTLDPTRTAALCRHLDECHHCELSFNSLASMPSHRSHGFRTVLTLSLTVLLALLLFAGYTLTRPEEELAPSFTETTCKDWPKIPGDVHVVAQALDECTEIVRGGTLSVEATRKLVDHATGHDPIAAQALLNHPRVIEEIRKIAEGDLSIQDLSTASLLLVILHDTHLAPEVRAKVLHPLKFILGDSSRGFLWRLLESTSEEAVFETGFQILHRLGLRLTEKEALRRLYDRVLAKDFHRGRELVIRGLVEVRQEDTPLLLLNYLASPDDRTTVDFSVEAAHHLAFWIDRSAGDRSWAELERLAEHDASPICRFASLAALCRFGPEPLRQERRMELMTGLRSPDERLRLIAVREARQRPQISDREDLERMASRESEKSELRSIAKQALQRLPSH